MWTVSDERYLDASEDELDDELLEDDDDDDDDDDELASTLVPLLTTSLAIAHKSGRDVQRFLIHAAENLGLPRRECASTWKRAQFCPQGLAAFCV